MGEILKQDFGSGPLTGNNLAPLHKSMTYFQGDGHLFGQIGKFYRWVVPYAGPDNPGSFVEITKEQYIQITGQKV